MDHAQRELLVHRISSGTLPCRLHGTLYVLFAPTPNDRLSASEAYSLALQDSTHFSPAELHDFLYANALWDDGREAILKGIEEDIDTMKIKLYEAALRPVEQEATRKLLVSARKKLAELQTQKHSCDYLGAEAFARTARARVLVACCLQRMGTPIWATPERALKSRSRLLDDVAALVASNALSEADYRELARTDPWSSLWATRAVGSSLFGVPAVNLTDEQRALVAWSTSYDNIRQHPECPTEEVINDDDSLDGWMLLKRRERNSDENKKLAESLVKGAGANCDEVFIPVGSAREAELVESLNGPGAMAAKKARYAALGQQGALREDQLPDVRQRLLMEANRRA